MEIGSSRRPLRAWRLARWLGLAALLSAFGIAPAVYAAVVRVNSDVLYLAALYRDLFVDRVGLAGWAPQPATSLFPDAPVFFVLRALLGNAGLAIGAYAAVVLLAVAALVSELGHQAGLAPWTRRLAAVAGASAIGLAAFYERIFDHAIYPSSHGGSFVVGMGVLALVARQVRSARPLLGALLGIAILSGATAAFDRIFFLWCGAPLAGAIVFCALVRVVPPARCAWVAVALACGAAISLIGHPVERGLGMTVPVLTPTLDVSVTALARETRVLGEWKWNRTVVSLVVAAALVTMVGAISPAIRAMRRLAGRTGNEPLDGASQVRVLVGVAVVLSVVCTLTGVAWSGMFSRGSHIRYLQPAYVIPCLGLPFVLALVANRRARLAIAGATGVFALLFGVATKPSPPPIPEELTVRPQTVACVDDVAARTDARSGYASYWNARRTTELSRAHVRLLSVWPDAQDYLWIANPRWYADLRATRARFLVLTAGLEEHQVRARFGEPREVATCGDGSVVWVYDGR